MAQHTHRRPLFCLLLPLLLLLSISAYSEPVQLPTGSITYGNHAAAPAKPAPNAVRPVDPVHRISAMDLSLTPPTDPIYIHGDEAREKLDRALPKRMMVVGLLTIPFDKAIVRNVHRTPSGETSDALTETLNSFGSGLLLASVGALYLAGDKRDKESAKLTGTAIIYAGALTQAVKLLAGRERPNLANDEPVFHGPSLSTRYDSFPSGHTSIAFAAATVMAHRYPKHRWAYYALAAGVGLARIRKSAHFPSDVIAGAGIGIYCGNISLRAGPSILGFRF